MINTASYIVIISMILCIYSKINTEPFQFFKKSSCAKLSSRHYHPNPIPILKGKKPVQFLQAS